MSRLQNLSIRRKQMLIIMLASSVALLLACVAFVAYDTITFRQELVEKEATLAEVLGNTVTAAIDFNDHKTAEGSLAALRGDDNIVSACIYDHDGQVFATYQRDSEAKAYVFPPVRIAGQEFAGDHLHLFRYIKRGNEVIGTIFIVSDLHELSVRRARYAGIAGLVFLLSSLIAFALSGRLQRIISNPILQLAQVVGSIVLEKNYSVRAVQQSDDELGQLIDGFNEMLAQIQDRDAALQAATDHLEHRVEERTLELAQSLSLLNATIDSTADGILAVQFSGAVVCHNSQFAAMWKIPADGLTKWTKTERHAFLASQVKNPEHYQAVVKEEWACPETETFNVVEMKDGRIFERYVRPQQIEGRCVGMVVNCRDITQRKRAEEALRETQALYLSLVEQLPSGVFRKDAAGRYVFANASFCRVMELPVDQILGKTAAELVACMAATQGAQRPVSDQLGTQGMSHHELIMRTGQQIVVEDEYQGSDGKRSCYHTVKSAVFNADRKIIGTQGVLFDITARKRAEETLRHERNFADVALNSLPGIFYLFDQNGKFLRWNENFETVTGYSAEEIARLTPLDLVLGPDKALVQERIGEVFVKGGSCAEAELVSKTGQRTPYYFTGRQIQIADKTCLIGTGTDSTQRKQAEEAFRESQALYHSLVEQLPVGVFRKDKEGRFVFVNSWYCRLKGVTEGKILGKTPQEVAASEWTAIERETKLAAQGTKHHEQIMQTGRPIELEEQNPGADGKPQYLHVVKSPTFGPDGKIVGSQGILVDITERKQAEAALAAASELLEALLGNTLDFIYFKDRESRFIRYSRVLLSHFGLTEPDALVGKTDFDCHSEERARSAYEDEQEIIRTGKPLISKLEKETHADGQVTWVLTSKMPWHDADGNIAGTFGISRDVTALKETEAELANERHLLRTLLDSSTDCIYFKDRESRFIRASSALAKLFNLRAADELIGKCDFDFFTEEHARPAYEDEQRIIHTGQPMIGKTEKETWPDGHVTWALTSKLPLRNIKGEIIGTFGISKDVTAIKEAEAKLDVVHKQLLETSRQAGMAEVATSVLHNVGNVLNSVNVSATLVADNTKKSKAPYLGKVVALLNEHAADLGAFMTNDPKGLQLPGYLTQLAGQLASEQQSAIAELESLRKNIEHIKDIVAMQQSYAKVSGVTETIKVTDLVEDALRMNAGALTRHEVEVAREYAEVPPVTVEKHKVLQVLVNLIRNAKYACDESGRADKRLTVRVANGAGRIKIAVIDNGIGIPAENLTRIFNHGFTTRKEGHGFGLHSGALAAKEMGGALTVQSDGNGLGATFTLELPYEPPSRDSSDRERGALG